MQTMKSNGGSPYDPVAAHYDELFGDDNLYYGPITACEQRAFDEFVPIVTEETYGLDVGCGTGLHTSWLASRGYRAVGIDNSREMLRVAAAKGAEWARSPHLEFRDALDETPVQGEPFAVVSCLGSTLNHIDDWRRLARVVSRRLVPGGVFLFSYDNLMGIDIAARTLLRETKGYSNKYFRDIVMPRLGTVLFGGAFRNHWRVALGVSQAVDVGLTYEKTSHWRGYLRDAGLEVRALRGVHVLDCFDKRVLRASAGTPSLNGALGVRNRRLQRSSWLAQLDKKLASRLYCIAANVVGVAVKTDCRS